MHYISFSFEQEQFWIELDDNGYAYREIIFKDSIYHVSCREDCLAEGEVVKENLPAKMNKMTKEDFESVWNLATQKYREEWSYSKKKYCINDLIEGKVMYFYPQGAICIGKDAIINYKGTVKVKINTKTIMKVVGYDDANMWIIAE